MCPGASGDGAVLVFPREFLCVRRGVRVRRTVGVAFHRNGRDGDDRALRESFFQVVVFRLALSQAQPPAVIVDHDIDVIRVVEGGSAAIERSVVELPLWRSELPDQLRKLVPVFFVAGTATVAGKIELVPPFELGLRRQRLPAGFLIADQVTAHGDHGLAALRPERREDVGGPRPPIEAGEDWPLDLESVQKILEIDGERRWLTVSHRCTQEKSRRAVAAQVRNEHPVARSCEHGRNIDKAVNVVRPAVQENDDRPIGGAGFGVADIQNARIDLLQRTERLICSWLDCRDLCLHPLRCRRTDHAELSGGDCHRGGAKEGAALLVNFLRHPDASHG